MAQEPSTQADIEAIVQQALDHYREHEGCLLGRCASLAPLAGMSSHQLLDLVLAFEADPEAVQPSLLIYELKISEVLRHRVAQHILARLTRDRHADVEAIRVSRLADAVPARL